MSLAFDARIRRLAPIIGFAVTFICYRLYFIASDIDGLATGVTLNDLGVLGDGSSAIADRALAKLTWSVTGAFFAIAFVGSVAMLLKLLWAFARQLAMPHRYRLYAALLLASVAIAVFAHSNNPFAVNDINPLLARSFELLDMPKGVWLLHATTPMVLVVLLLLIVTAWSVLERQPSEGVEAAAHLRKQIAHLNTALFVGAIMLVAGVVHASALHQLPGILIDREAAAAWARILNGLSASTGTIWTFLLLGIFGPSLYVVRERARRLAAGEASAKEDMDKWLADNGLKIQGPSLLTQILALLGPLIAGGPAAPLLHLVTG